MRKSGHWLVTGLLIMLNATEASASTLTDFSDATADLGWYVVNDNVMGGRSDGDFAVDDGTLHFRGSLNTNGGGFSSIRSAGLSLDLSDASGIRLRVRGDGRRYSFQLRTDVRFRGQPIGFWADFDTTADEWIDVDLPFTAFEPRFRGVELQGPPLDAADITGMGLMLADGIDGDFAIALDAISAFREVAAFTLERYRWEKRVLVVHATDAADPRLAEQREAVAAEAAAFDERDLKLVTLAGSDVLVGNAETSSGDADAVRRVLGLDDDEFEVRLIGKDGSVKFATDRPVAMQTLFATIDRMPMRQREIGAKRD